MLLSIIIPTRNRSGSLHKCLGALMSSIAGRSDCEVIVIDDHSKDEIANENRHICNAMHGDYLFLEKNQGAAGARNRGIETSKGEWIAFLDDDVYVEQDWFDVCIKSVSGLPPSTIGVEGKLTATGDGVWDKEVENLKGKAYLSCHIVYRKNMLERIGGFDESFISRYPACEDHELAMRALLWGDIAFNPYLHARHFPRIVRSAGYLRDSFQRMKSLLIAEFYFYQKHPDRYHLMRHARTFWGTYKNIVLFHLLVSLKRRSVLRLMRHPFQCATLVCASLLEQITAICLFPFYFYRLFDKGICLPFFKKHVDEVRTRNLWQMSPETDSSFLILKPFLLRSLLFPLCHKPVYSMARILNHLRDKTSLPGMRFFLRIDDVFMSDLASVKLLCEKLAERNMPFCAGITGNDLACGKYGRMINQIRVHGGEIALHGFTHSGRFGPYKSEILQMNFPDIDAKLRSVYNYLSPEAKPKIFIPPYNAISQLQIAYMTRHFKIICGGPETARFTDCYAGPVALKNDAWYFPSFFPFYNNASAMVRLKIFRSAIAQKGFVCITVHMPLEAHDDYKGLMRLLDLVADHLTSWNFLIYGEKK
jgi:glycosyltransferase involved in cell wall biosynthesis